MLVIYDPVAGRVIQRFDGHTWRVNAVKFSRDGMRLYSGGGDGLRIWSFADGKQISLINDHEGEIFAVDESPDGQNIVSGGGDSTIRISPVSTSP